MLSENIPDLIHKGFVFEIAVLNLRQLLQHFSLFFCKCLRRHKCDGDKKIALTACAEVRHSLALYPKDGTGLSAGWDLEVFLTKERLHLYLGTECRLRKCDRHRRIKICSLSLEIGMFGNVDHNEEIACRSPASSGFAFTGYTQPRTHFDSRGDLDLQVLFFFDPSLPLAGL